MRTITFYSYKGGVGRSLSLANIASRLAEFGKKVCLLDFDLEAPGLHFKFPSSKAIVIDKGIVDYIFEFTNSGVLPTSIKSFSIDFESPPAKKELTLIPAGNIDSKEYWKKLSTINWIDLLYKNENGLAFLLDLKEKIKSQINPDYLLIDSRTGVSEMSGITLSLLADEVVIVAANNKENLHGTKKVIESITNPKNNIPGRIIKVTFVLSRVPFTDNASDKTKEQNLITRIKREYLSSLSGDINIIHSDRELEENEKIKIGYEKDASIAQISRDYLNLFEKLTQDDFTAEELIKFNNIKKSETFYLKAINSKSATEKIELLTKAIELNDSNFNLFYSRAVEYFGQKIYDKAKSDFLRSVKRLIYFPAYEFLGKIYIDEGSFEEARKAFNNILRYNSRYFGAYLGLGNLAYIESKFEESIEHFTKAIEIAPESPDGFNGRACCKRLLGQFDEALQDIYRALELDPNHVFSLSTLAEIKADQGKLSEFYLTLEMALKLDAKSLESIIAKEKIYKRFYDEERFLKMLEKYNIPLVNNL